jgi:hypothetical protein
MTWEGRTIVVAGARQPWAEAVATRCAELGGAIRNATDRPFQDWAGASDPVCGVAGLVYCVPEVAIPDGDAAAVAEAVRCVLDAGFGWLDGVGARLRGRRDGSIVAVTGGDGLKAQAGRAASCVALAAWHMGVQVRAIEWAADHVRVNAVAPARPPRPHGRVEPAAWPEEARAARAAMGLPVTAVEVADVVAFLLGDESRYLTGEVVRVDRGWSSYSLF